MSTPDADFTPERWSEGDQVEVLNKLTGEWIPATIERRWTCAIVRDNYTLESPGDGRYFDYDCTGTLPDGDPWHGTFDNTHVRRAAGAPKAI